MPHLDARMGRPSKELHVVIGGLLLQQLHDLTDTAAVEALAFNMAWHYALDVRSEADCYFCEKTLRNYRRLFIAQGLDEMLFRRMSDRLVSAFSVDTSRQRMNSTGLDLAGDREAAGALRSLQMQGLPGHGAVPDASRETRRPACPVPVHAGPSAGPETTPLLTRRCVPRNLSSLL